MSKARSQINKAEVEYKKIMSDNILNIGSALIKDIMFQYKKLPRSEQPNAVNNVKVKGHGLYSEELKAAYTAVSAQAMIEAMNELDMEWKDFSFSNQIILGEFEKMPKGLRTRINKRVLLTVGAQVADIQKEIYFEFLDEINRTDSAIVIEEAMEARVVNYAGGRSVSSGSTLLASYSVNDARAAVFFSTEGKANMDALMFSNPSPVAAICVNLNGQIFSADQKGAAQYYPPLHWGCKSILVPIKKGKLGNREIGKLQPQGTGAQIKEANKSVQFSHLEIISRCACCS